MPAAPRTTRHRQLALPFSPVRNSELLSNHWLDHRLQLEPEWTELRNEAEAALNQLLSLWKPQRSRVEKYRKEAPLEHAFIQPVFEALGWTLFYQTFLQGREPDYALFHEDSELQAALQVGTQDPGFWKYPTLVTWATSCGGWRCRGP